MANKRLKKKLGRRRNGEGSVSERSDGLFQASFMKNGKRKFEYALTEKAAYDKLEMMRDKARRGVSLTEGDVTLNELVASYIERYAKPYVRPSTLKNYKGYAENYLKNSPIGKMRVGRIAADDIQDFVNILVGKELSGKTIRNIISFVDSVFAQAVRNRLISLNPCAGVRLPKIKTKERPLISEEEYNMPLDIGVVVDICGKTDFVLAVLLKPGAKPLIKSDLARFNIGISTDLMKYGVHFVSNFFTCSTIYVFAFLFSVNGRDRYKSSPMTLFIFVNAAFIISFSSFSHYIAPP